MGPCFQYGGIEMAGRNPPLLQEVCWTAYAQQQCSSRAGDGTSTTGEGSSGFTVPVRTKVSKKPPESTAPAPLSRRKNSLYISPVIFYTYHVHYFSYVSYVYYDIL
jgi:hypothetical protein